jgi:hypothetical protein
MAGFLAKFSVAIVNPWQQSYMIVYVNCKTKSDLIVARALTSISSSKRPRHLSYCPDRLLERGADSSRAPNDVELRVMKANTTPIAIQARLMATEDQPLARPLHIWTVFMDLGTDGIRICDMFYAKFMQSCAKHKTLPGIPGIRFTISAYSVSSYWSNAPYCFDFNCQCENPRYVAWNCRSKSSECRWKC